MTKVLIADAVRPRAGEVFRTRGLAFGELPKTTQKELAECIIEYDGIAVLKLPLVQKAKSLIFSNPLNLTK